MFMQLFFGARRRSPTTVELWQWRYRDSSTGRACRTAFRMTAEEAAKYPQAERIEGTLVLRNVDLPQGGIGLLLRRLSARVSTPV